MSTKLHKLTMRRLLNVCKQELRKFKPHFQVMSYEEQITTVFNMVIYQIYKRNKDKSRSLKFSDYIREEPYLDHYLFRICRDIEAGKFVTPIQKVKKEVKRFGVFDLASLEKQRTAAGVKIEPKKLSPEEAKKSLSEVISEPFPWEETK